MTDGIIGMHQSCVSAGADAFGVETALMGYYYARVPVTAEFTLVLWFLCRCAMTTASKTSLVGVP